MDVFFSMLRDPATRTIIAVLAASATILSFLVGQWLWRRKSLTYSISRTRLLLIHKEAKGRVQILFDGEPAKDVALVDLTVANSGYEPIRADDFDRPLKFLLGDDAQILNVEVTDPVPDSLKPLVKSNVTYLEVEPLLLNRGDKFRIKILVNRLERVSVDGRVVGVREIKLEVSEGPSYTSLACLIVGVLIMSLAVYLDPTPRPQPPPPPASMPLPVLAIFLVGVSVVSIGFVMFIRTLRIGHILNRVRWRLDYSGSGR